MIRTAVLFLALACLCTADTIYTYTGPDFTEVTGTSGPTTSDDITLTFTLATPLPDDVTNLPFEELGFTPISWSMSDGVNTLSSSQACPNYSGPPCDDFGGDVISPTQNTISIDAAGNIIGWDIVAQEPNNNDFLLGSLVVLSTQGVTWALPPGGSQSIDSSITYFGPYGIYSPSTSYASVGGECCSGPVGTWTITEISAVPEPGKLPLILTVLLVGTVFVKNRWFTRSHNPVGARHQARRGCPYVSFH